MEENGAAAGTRAAFIIEARTRTGDRVSDGGDPFQVKIEGPYKLNVENVALTDNKGNYNPVNAIHETLSVWITSIADHLFVLSFD